MLFPDSAKNAIANTFYDKTISVMRKTEQLDDQGGLIKSGTEVKSTFKGNVRFLAFGQEQNEIGLTKVADIQITCPTDTAVEVDDFLQYGGVQYVATEVNPSDSHLTILGQRWVSQ